MKRDDVMKILGGHKADLKRFGVKSLRLFGSVARDEAANGSDVDLLVDFRQTPSFSGSMKLRIYLEDLLDATVDLVTETGLKEHARTQVERDAIVVA